MDNITDILSNLSAQDIENLKETAAALFSQNKQEEPQNNGADSLFGSMGVDPQMISKISGIMQAMNRDDSRCDLIRALKPHLRPERQHRADEAIRLLKIISALPILREQNLF
ncbi:MAG: hypothetical protein IKU25_01550 [Clostridia bacterium]|nr:hypothetical protein [Clostridia bacterium]